MTHPQRWALKPGSELSTSELYDCLQLRAEVFAVEQNCVYQDLDGIDLDPATYHLFGYVDGDANVAAYLRIFGEKGAPEKFHIGRVVVREKYRSTGLGRAIMNRALELIDGIQVTRHISSVIVEGQSHLRKWYESFGFQVQGDVFQLDGIPHYYMVKPL